MVSRIYLFILAISLSCSGCHLVKPVFSKSVPSTSPAGKSSTASAPAPATAARASSPKGSPVEVKKIKTTPASGNPSKVFPNEAAAPAGLRPADHLYVLQDPPAVLQVKYAILLDVVAEKLTNSSLLQVMDTWWGTRYCMGGSTDNCIDCSAFVQVMYRDVYQVALPRTAQEQYGVSELIERDELKEGDLVFFHTRGRKNSITHVGIYLQNNKFVHASTSNGVSISDLDESYWKPKFRGGGRLKSQG
jgi:cell wall-associated NlpC family hydrolase